MVALVALAVHDANNTAIQVYNSFSPATAMSDALTRNVKINGIVRKAATHSTVDVTLTGQTGTTITHGSVKDTRGVAWSLPASVTIGSGGAVTVTATCATAGAVEALAGSITRIATPTLGWVAVSNAMSATQIRIRQAQSVAISSITPFEALEGAIANVAGVTRHKLYENDTGVTDGNGLPAHSLSAIVDGGDVTAIAQTLRGKKGQGVSTFGSTSVTVADLYGNPHVIRFSRSTNVPIYAAITLSVFPGYTTQVGEQIKQAIADYVNSLSIGDDVLLSRVYSPANLGVVSGGSSRFYDINSLRIGRSPTSAAAANIAIAYNESASCSTANIAITVAS